MWQSYAFANYDADQLDRGGGEGALTRGACYLAPLPGHPKGMCSCPPCEQRYTGSSRLLPLAPKELTTAGRCTTSAPHLGHWYGVPDTPLMEKRQHKHPPVGNCSRSNDAAETRAGGE